MSDPMSKADYEDVLSSIRRLVSNEQMPELVRRRTVSEQNIERFVLTPAFRVTAEDDEATDEFAAVDLDTDADQEGGDSPEQQDLAETDLADAGAEPVVLDTHDDPEQVIGIQIATAAEETVSNSQIAPEVEGENEWTEQPEADQAEEAPSDAKAVHQPEVKPETHRKPVAELTLEERIAELEAALERSPQEWEPDGSEDGSSDETRPLSYAVSVNEPGLASVLTDPVEDSQDDLAAQDADHSEADAVHPEITVEPTEETDSETAGILELFSESDDDEGPEPETTADAEAAMPEAELPPQEDQQDEEEQDSDWQSAEPETHADEPEPEPEPEPESEMEQAQDWLDVEVDFDSPSDPEPEAATRPTQKPADVLRAWEEDQMRRGLDDVPVDSSDADEPDWDDAKTEIDDKEDTIAATMRAPSDEEETENILADDDEILDEDTLRQMVSNLVREELQGVLGERITRNVRRLVRREIQRAMALRDLE